MKTEDLGFKTIVGYGEKLSPATGTTLLGGAAIAAGFAYLQTSSPRAEKAVNPLKMKQKVEDYRAELWKRLSKDDAYSARIYWEKNDDFHDDLLLADAVRSGITPEEFLTLESAASNLIPDDLSDPAWKTRVEALKKLLQRKNAVSWIHHFGHLISEDDPEKLLSFPDEAFFIDELVVFKKGRRDKGVDWEETAKNLERLKKLPQDVLMEIVPISHWFDPWVEKDIDYIYKAATVRDIMDSKLEFMDETSNGPLSPDTKLFLDRALELSKTGDLQKLNTIIKNVGGTYTDIDLDELKGLVTFIYKYGHAVPWNTYLELMEGYDKMVAGAEPGEEFGLSFTDELPSEDSSMNRFYDRFAQLHPEWAIERFPNEYRRGKRIAKVIDAAVKEVADMIRMGEHVVVHGRDGELLYAMLKEIPGLDLRKLHYAITSRPLTTMSPKVSETYMDYLGRTIPKNAIHIDTGFWGSIPRWLDQKGFNVRSIKMVSAIEPDERLNIPMSSDALRVLVLSDLEHSAQRLAKPSSFDKLPYGKGAPGFWARFFGVRDELKLPRFAKEGTTRFEKMRFRANNPEPIRLRIATETPEEVDEDPEAEDLVKKTL